ncbi:MAG TPA: sensor histidine kinase [Solirubrobacteraceae bacterium]|nr:sensor histidine kinase [Solirubrobacteraceae bacterium]
MTTLPARRDAPFRHEAVMYAGLDEFADRMSAFIRDGVAAGEPTLVVVSAEKIARLRAELGADAEGVLFADMADVGANPGRIIPAWREFVSAHATGGRPLRGIGEPIHPERSACELVECHRHEALLNLAFADTRAFWLVCPYDTDALAPAVVETARRTHPSVVSGGVAHDSALFDGLQAIAAPFADPLADPPAEAPRAEIGLDALGAVRRFVLAHASAVLSPERANDLLLAVNELATNTVRHGGGHGVLTIWREPGALICDVTDAGRIEQPLVGRVRPRPAQIGGYGLWLANQLCDLVQVRAFATGGAVRVHMRLD